MKGSSVDQRKGFLVGLAAGAVIGVLVTLAISAVFGRDTVPTADPGTATTSTSSPVAIDDVPQVINPPDNDGFVDQPVGRSAIPDRTQATTIQSRSKGIYASNGARLTGSQGAVAFAYDRTLVYQLLGPDSPIFVDRGAGADVLASPNVQIRLLSLGFRDGAPLAIVKLLEPAVVEGVETINERLATVDTITGEISDYGVVAGFESTLVSATLTPTGFILGIRAEGDAFLQTLGFDGTQSEVIVPCFAGTCPRRPWSSTDGRTVAYLSGLSNLVIYDLASDRVLTDIDLGIPISAGESFPGWAITDFDDVTVAVAEITFDADGNLTYGNAFLITLGGEITEYATQGAITFIR